MSQAKNIDSTMAAAKLSESHMDLVKQLEFQMMDMTTSFATWFSGRRATLSLSVSGSRRGGGLKHELEATEDGMVPFSLARQRAPTIFTIFYSWTTNLGRISNTKVVGTMRALISNVWGLWRSTCQSEGRMC
ncbi:hypothetical protein BS78_K038700 [Paspalum vaginatum]|uniref:DUF632 domain-containing protein n=1 Tax=Paspalum vaginatum TaxID=158149 RepID=A0A9W8CG44_9POAL|nr:hypothetical protein BS78_K038700 [Paspalum vaginatum]